MATNAAKLKIGLIIDTSLDTTEGVPQYVVTLGEWLRTQGHEVHYLAGETKRQDLPNMHSLTRNIGVRFNGTTTTIPLPTSRRKLRQFIERESFDVLHVQTPHHPLMAQYLIRAAGPATAVIGTFHVLPYGWLSRIGTRALGWWLRPSLRRFDQMLAVSPAAVRYEQWAFGLPAKVSPNMIDYPLFHQAKPLSHYDDAKLTILFLGRLVPRKGCALLLAAVAQLAERSDLPAFRVVVCGKGHLRPRLEQFVKDHSLSNKVEFVGFVSEADKPGYYASADLAVFPSSGGESFGIVLLEAMACGQAAVLAGDNPGYRSVMEPEPDLLFDPKNAVELADKLAAYLIDTSQRRHLAKWGSTYTKDFDVAVVGQKMLATYNEALHKRRQS